MNPNLDLGAPSYDEDIAEERRNRLMTKKHTIPEKMELYNSSTKGNFKFNLDDLKKIVLEKNFSLVEEVSKAGYYWTVFHYASHYGHVNILQFLIGHFENHPDKFEIFNLQTVEGKTPLFCAILSGDIKIEQKKEIVKLFLYIKIFDSHKKQCFQSFLLWFDTYVVDLQLRKKTGEDLLEMAKKNNLYEFIVDFCIRED